VVTFQHRLNHPWWKAGQFSTGVNNPAQAKQVLEAILDGWGKSAADANTING